MKAHFCPVEKVGISFENECNWCGEKEMKTIMDMARESHIDVYGLGKDHDKYVSVLERFAALVRNDERARCISHVYGQAGSDNVAERTVKAIRSGK